MRTTLTIWIIMSFVAAIISLAAGIRLLRRVRERHGAIYLILGMFGSSIYNITTSVLATEAWRNIDSGGTASVPFIIFTIVNLIQTIPFMLFALFALGVINKSKDGKKHDLLQ